MSARLKLTLSYAGFLMVAGALIIAIVWLFLLRYVPAEAVSLGEPCEPGTGGRCPPSFFSPGRYDLWRAFAPKAGALLVFLLVLGLAGGWFLAGRMLAPLTRITHATRMAANGSLAHRIRMAGRRDEFRELADAFDAMLARIEAHVAEQQRFAANASHELRTPLAITQTLLDVARNDPDREADELVDRLHFVNARAIDLTEALLLLSRADLRSFTRERVDLSLVAEEAAETLLPLAEQRVAGSSSLRRRRRRRRLARAAAADGHEPGAQRDRPQPGRRRHRVGRDRGALRSVALTVENTGQKLTPHLVSTLTEPFQRGSRRIRSDHAGVGLGLAIVKSIVGAHDGDLTLAPRPDGGLRVEVRLPLEVA